ncbi:MAG TPA: hypothetical protein VIO61_10760 [Anaerolineaceae bacterium]
MPVLKYAHLCEYARVDSAGTISVIAIFDHINLPAIPGTMPFFHVITVWLCHSGDRFDFQTRIADPEGKIIASVPTNHIEVQGSVSGSLSIPQVNGYLGTHFQMAGDYSVEILVNEIVVHTIPFTVRKTGQGD